MGDPHNKKRYGEVWPQYKINAYLRDLYVISPNVVLSGGWAWHFLSPPGHVEYKHAHNHKDLDVLIPPNKVQSVIMDLEDLNFVKAPTRFDKHPTKEEFRRYEKIIDGPNPFRVTIDFFVKEVLFRQIGEYRVIEPEELLKLYKTIHSSDNCWAVTAARHLIDIGLDPQNRPEMILPPEEF